MRCRTDVEEILKSGDCNYIISSVKYFGDNYPERIAVHFLESEESPSAFALQHAVATFVIALMAIAVGAGAVSDPSVKMKLLTTMVVASIAIATSVRNRMLSTKAHVNVWSSRTYKQLYEDYVRVARNMQSNGIIPSTKLWILWLPGNKYDMIVLMLAASAVGVNLIGADPKHVGGLVIMFQKLTEVEPDMLLVGPSPILVNGLRLYNLLTGKLAFTKRYIDGSGLFAPAAVHSGHAGAEPSAFKAFIASPSDCMAVAFTTGSTGSPKGVNIPYSMINIGHLVGQAKLVLPLLKPRADGKPTVTLHHALNFSLLDLGLGNTCVLPKGHLGRLGTIDAAFAVATAARFNADIIAASPDLMRRMIMLRSVPPSVQLLVSYGCEIHAWMFAEAESSKCPLMSLYGATEAGPLAVLHASQLDAAKLRRYRSGGGVCLGSASAEPTLVKYHVKLPARSATSKPSQAIFVSYDSADASSFGVFGEICVSGIVVSPSYINPQHTATLKTLLDDGTVIHGTGDFGYIDSDGFVWLLGRMSHAILAPLSEGVVDEKAIHSVSVESLVLCAAYPAVLGCALVSICSRNSVAVQPGIVLRPALESNAVSEATLRDIREALRAAEFDSVRNANFEILVYPSSMAWPVDARHESKINRSQLSAWAAEALASRMDM